MNFPRLLHRDNGVATVLTAGTTVAAAAQTASLAAGGAGTKNFLSQIVVTGLGATAGSAVDMLVAGIEGGTKTIQVGVPAGATTPITPINLRFEPPIPASADDTAITVTLPSFGTGNTDACLFVTGFRVLTS